jgi:hypothetical protein
MVLFCGLLQKVPVLRSGKMIEEADWVMYNCNKENSELADSTTGESCVSMIMGICWMWDRSYE